MKSFSELPDLTKLSFLGGVLHMSHSWTSRSLFLVLPIFWSCILIQFKIPFLSWMLVIMLVVLTGLHFCITTRKRSLQSYTNVTAVLCNRDGQMLACGISFADDWVPQKADLRGFKISMEKEMFQTMTVFIEEFWKYESFLSYLALNQATRGGFFTYLK